MRYESCAMAHRILFCDSDFRKSARTVGVSSGSRHWLGVFVKSWMTVAPMAAPRPGAV